MRCLSILLLLVVVALPPVSVADTVRLKATADIWLSDANESERSTSAGAADRIKLKSIQELGAFRFDASPVKGREVRKATLFLKRASEDSLRHFRVSTVAADWVEGKTDKSYGPADGATWYYADSNSKRPWAWPGSQFVDAIMGNGNTLTTWTECRKLDDGWIAVDMTPALIYAMVAGDTDGLAVMEGGTMAFVNNFIYSCQSKGNEPYIEVELGETLTAVPARPEVQAKPALERAHLGSGAIKVAIGQAPDIVCYKVSLNGQPVERWRVKHPAAKGATVFYLEDLKPSAKYSVQVEAASKGGLISAPAKVEVTSSPALASDLKLGKFEPPKAKADKVPQAGNMRVWAAPPLVKVDPITGDAMFADAGNGKDDYRLANAVFDGRTIKLAGGRGEYVSYQLCVENLDPNPLTKILVAADALAGPQGAAIGRENMEISKNWYAKNGNGHWQAAYCVPMKPSDTFDVPDEVRQLPKQHNQSVYVDVYIPKDAKTGAYRGTVSVYSNVVFLGQAFIAKDTPKVSIPIELTVYDFQLPDQLAFWPELNAYSVPANATPYYRLAQQHRCVCNYWVPRPKLEGKGKDIKVIWDEYDKRFGPLFDGSAFKDSRRGAVPLEVMYLPFEDSWPTPLSKENYNYQGHWPTKGEDTKYLVEQVLKAPYIGDALSQEYKDAFLAVQRQFIEHFKEKGWNKTEMQCFYGGKKTHRTQYGVNMWWTTDEPYHWDDWMALEFFCRLWSQRRDKIGASPTQWKARADISRPNWQDKILAGVLNTEYIGGFSSPGNYRRCRILAQDTGVTIRDYGSANPDNASNTQSLTMLVNLWLNGSNGHLPWQTLGSDKALDVNDAGASGGNALIVPGTRFGVDVVGDMRLKALRDGEQIIEYMTILAAKRGLQREQIQAMVLDAVRIEAGRKAGAGADDADALRFSTLKDWQISQLRQRLAELITK
jgi:hypothetical protein